MTFRFGAGHAGARQIVAMRSHVLQQLGVHF
jgi:hypothetical protein